MAMTIGWLFLVFVYLITTCVSLYATLLYRGAFIKMKRTKMIGSVYYLLASICFSSLWFLTLIVTRQYPNYNFIYEYMVVSYIWSIPRIPILVSLIYFIYASLSPPDTYKDFEKAHKKIRKLSGGKK